MSDVNDARTTRAASEGEAAEQAGPDRKAEPAEDRADERASAEAPDAFEGMPEDEAPTLQSELQAEREKAQSYLNDLKRVQADFINFKRRTEQDQVERAKLASARLILNILPVLDDLERALESAGPNLAGLHWVQGINLIARKLRGTLEAEGLSSIEALGEEFDPHVHEAVIHEESRSEDAGKVIDVLQAGYKLHDRVIRPAIVKVGKASSDAG
ncbi:MAG TPA: nucleotide exchange factor GrpE [Chloroflexota bacterium]|nr:nucleotide exchange factor GrpE [Chloroflexota bacterium]